MSKEKPFTSMLDSYNKSIQQQTAEEKEKADVGMNLKKAQIKETAFVQKEDLIITFPVVGRVSSVFQKMRLHPKYGVLRDHEGIDIASPEGTPIYSLCDGVVVYAEKRGGLGQAVKIRRTRDGIFVTYGHCSKMFVKAEQSVTKGKKLAEIGNTGAATGYHLHLEVRDVRGKPVHPDKWSAMGLQLSTDPIIGDIMESASLPGLSSMMQTALSIAVDTVTGINRVEQMSQAGRARFAEGARNRARRRGAANKSKIANELAREEQLGKEPPKRVVDITNFLYEANEF